MEVLKNSEKVYAVTDDGKSIEYTLGKLKDDFMKGVLAKQGLTIAAVYVIRTNQSFTILYSPRKGFKYKLLGNKRH